MKDIVYITTNHINGKQYVGSHSTENLEDSYLGSGVLIKKAIKKYGRQNFSKEIIKICNNREEAVLLEEVYIKEHDTLNPVGYNLSPYGNAAFPGHKNPMYGKIPWNKGIPMTENHRQKTINGLKGNKNHLNYSHSDESKWKIGKASEGNQYWVGKSHSEESRKKMRESHLGQIPVNKGIPMPETQKAKLRISKIGQNPFENMPIGKCIHCGAEMKQSHLNRYHNDNCKFKK